MNKVKLPKKWLKKKSKKRVKRKPKKRLKKKSKKRLMTILILHQRRKMVPQIGSDF